MSTSGNRGGPSGFGFLALDNFTLIALSAAIEPLRMANRIVGREHFRWKLLSSSGEPVAASDGIAVNVDRAIDHGQALDDVDLLVVCGGVRVEQSLDRQTRRFLRHAGKKEVALGAICTGSYALAATGLLDGYSCSIHWEKLRAFRTEFPNVNVRRSLFTIDRDRYTSSGGTAPIDMMVHIVRKQLGEDVGTAIAEQFICDRIRRADDEQRIPLRHQLGSHAGKLIAAVELMEANLLEPLSQKDLADYVGLSRRQLQRLFRAHLLCAPSRYYLRLRLGHARELLLRTAMSIQEVTTECGFVSTSHFSKSYKEHFGYSPSIERQRPAAM